VQPLVTRTETRLADGGLLALLAAMLLVRYGVHLLLFRQPGLLDSQLVAGCGLLVLLNLAGLLLPRSLSGVVQTLGLLAWVYALSLLPRYLWPTGTYARGVVYAALALALLSFVLRLVMRARWGAAIYGKGWAWIDRWAQDRSLRARVFAKQALVALGYRRAKAAGQVES
jgi:hypothetical protein